MHKFDCIYQLDQLITLWAADTLSPDEMISQLLQHVICQQSEIQRLSKRLTEQAEQIIKLTPKG